MDKEKCLDEIKADEEALDESLALNRLAFRLLDDQSKNLKRVWIALIISILVNLITVGAFLWYESQWEYTTETTTITQDTDEGYGDNVYQSGEHAVYDESGGDN